METTHEKIEKGGFIMPWRCKYCVWYHFCKIGRCAMFLPLDRFTGRPSLQRLLDEAWEGLSGHESSLGPDLGGEEVRQCG